MIEALTQFKQYFPYQKLLLPRAKTSWDMLLVEIGNKSRTMQYVYCWYIQLRKQKLALRYHMVRLSKMELVRKYLQNYYRYLYHRMLSSLLAEQISTIFHKHQTSINGVYNILTDKQSQQYYAEIIMTNKYNSIYLKHNNHDDDIFYEKNDYNDHEVIMEYNGLLDDLLNTHPIVMEEVEEEVKVGNVKNYIGRYVIKGVDGHGHSVTRIARKGCFKRMNENVRRRVKLGGEEDVEQGRSLGSAIVALSSLMGVEMEEYAYIELPSNTYWLFGNYVNRARRRREYYLYLRWNYEYLGKMGQLNDKYNFRQSKIDAGLLYGNVLCLLLPEEYEEYRKVFEKNIVRDSSFPPSLHNVLPFLEEYPQQYYYNEFPDHIYEQFVMRNNKKKLLYDFAKNSGYIFAYNYAHDELYDAYGISLAKMFVYPPQRVSQRLIYRLSDYKLTATLQNFERVPLPMDKDHLVLLAYLVRKYLYQFGNNWRLITHFIAINPCFSSYFVTTEAVQLIYQLVQRQKCPNSYLDDIELWDKKILPNAVTSQSYCQINQENWDGIAHELHSWMREYREDTTMEYEGSEENSEEFRLEDYEKIIETHIEEREEFGLKDTAESYKQFSGTLCGKGLQTGEYNAYKDSDKLLYEILEYFQYKQLSYRIPVGESKGEIEWVFKYVSYNLRGEIKAGVPFRKKKSM